MTDEGAVGDLEAIAGARQRLIPQADRLHETVVRLLPSVRPGEPYRVLDFGTGTGLLIERLLSRIPHASIHMMHDGEASLEAARSRLARFGDSITFELRDYVHATLQGPYDVAISELAASFLSTRARQTLYSSTFAALRRGGRAVNVILARGMTEGSEARLIEEWRRMAAENGASAEEIGGSIIASDRGRTATLAQQMEWMTDNGFENVDCYVKYWRFAVIAGDRV